MLFSIVLATTGCAQLEIDKYGWPGKPRPQKPDRIAVMWTDAVMNQPGLPGVRGFGARVMFHDQFHRAPVAVAGRFTVYAYDDTDDPNEARSVADRKFVFTAEQLDDHYSKSRLGHSYSFWIPWDEVGGPQRTITLVCRFESLQGGMVASEPAKQLLPGAPAATKPEAAVAQRRAAHEPTVQTIGQQPTLERDAQLAAYTPASTPLESRRRMTTTTIELPPAAAGRAAAISRAQYLELPGGAVAPASAQMPTAEETAREYQATSAGYVEPIRTPAGPAVAEDPASVAMASQILAQATALRQAPAAAPPVASGFRRPRLRALGAPIQQPRDDRAPTRPHPPGWPSDSIPVLAPAAPIGAASGHAPLAAPAMAPPPAGA